MGRGFGLVDCPCFQSLPRADAYRLSAAEGWAALASGAFLAGELPQEQPRCFLCAHDVLPSIRSSESEVW